MNGKRRCTRPRVGTAADALAFLRQPALFGELLADRRFTDTYASFVKAIYGGGGIRRLMGEMG